jgi:glycosyltransferase involved in cell wall biosynthesis
VRALLLSTSSRPGGAERAFAGLVRELPATGIEPLPVLLEDGPLGEWLREDGIEPVVLPTHRFRRVDRLAATIRSLQRLARGADAVVSSMSKAHVAAGAAARLAHVPSVWWQHGIPERTPIERTAALVGASAVVCVSDDAVAAQRRLTPKTRIVKIHPGIPLAAVRAQRGTGGALRSEHGWDGAIVVGIVARLERWKGQEIFLRAAARLAADPRLRFVVVGGPILGWEGDYPDELEQLAHELAIDDRTVFTGHRDDPLRWLDALDVVVNASFGEPFGLSVVEAMALGKPVVATAAGGPAETIVDGVSGVLVPVGDDAALAAALRMLIDDPELAAKLGAQAAERAEAFDERRTAEAFADLLRKVTA